MKRVAIIDDSELVLDITRLTLTEAGFEVVAMLEPTRDQLTGSRAPDLVLVDVNMPQAFGDDVAAFFRRQWGVSAPIYLYSSLPEEELRRRAREAQLDGFICKSEGKDHLVHRVREILGERRERRSMNGILDRFAERCRERGARIVDRLRQLSPDADTGEIVGALEQELHDWVGESKLLGFDGLAEAVARMGRLLTRRRGGEGRGAVEDWVQRLVALSREQVVDPSATSGALRELLGDLQAALEREPDGGADDAPAAQPGPDAAPAREEESRRILVLDDSPIVRDVLAESLGQRGHRVAVAQDYAEFNERLVDFDPQLVFLDVNMPDIKGDEVCRRVRKRTDVGGLPIIFLSSLPEEELAELARRSGASGHLSKQQGIEELLRFLDELLDQIIF